MLIKKENIKNEVKNSKNSKNTSPAAPSHPIGCCQPSQTTATPSTASSPMGNPAKHSDACTDKKTSSKTRITVKYDAGFPNQLSIRGKGAGLSWEKGQALKNVKPDEWIWESDAHFTSCEFKILINDRVYESGDNHHLNAGSSLLYTPRFQS